MELKNLSGKLNNISKKNAKINQKYRKRLELMLILINTRVKTNR